jgi:hypothetical protein
MRSYHLHILGLYVKGNTFLLTNAGHPTLKDSHGEVSHQEDTIGS